MQLDLPSKTNKKKGSNLTTEDEILLIEKILKGYLVWKDAGIKREGADSKESVNLEGHRSNFNGRFLIKIEKLIIV